MENLRFDIGKEPLFHIEWTLSWTCNVSYVSVFVISAEYR